MNPATPTPTSAAPRRRIWPWVVGFLCAPFVLLAIAAASYLTLDRDAAILRRHVMRASDGDWNTKVQFSVGRFSLGCVRTGLAFLPESKEHVTDARHALGAIRNASVGVYELAADADWAPAQIFAETDADMSDRGWTRVVGVSNPRETVMIYVDEDFKEGEPAEFCIAVVDGRQMVVVSATVDAEGIAEIVDRHAGGKIGQRIRDRIRL